jgi:hypothetical protein
VSSAWGGWGVRAFYFRPERSEVGASALESTPALTLQAGGLRFDPVTAHLQNRWVARETAGLAFSFPSSPSGVGKPMRTGSRRRVRDGNVVRVDTNRYVIRSGSVGVCGRHYRGEVKCIDAYSSSRPAWSSSRR